MTTVAQSAAGHCIFNIPVAPAGLLGKFVAFLNFCFVHFHGHNLHNRLCDTNNKMKLFLRAENTVVANPLNEKLTDRLGKTL